MKAAAPSILYSEELIRYLEETSRLGLVLIDGESWILACNNGFAAMLGLDNKPLGRKMRDFLSGSSPPLAFPDRGYQPVHLIFNSPAAGEMFLNGYVFPRGGSFVIAFEQSRMGHNELVEKMSRLNDQIVAITRELEKKNAALSEALQTIKRIMNVDPLTGLLNRRAFFPLLKKFLAFAKRHQLPLSCIMTDIDHFKAVNDTYGHEMGDTVLKKFARLLKNSTRQEDILGRFGGEEFVLILPNTPGGAALETAERMRKNLERMKFKGLKGSVTASFGIAERRSGDDEKSIVKRADDALYVAKGGGRNRCALM
jgi:diguanylate cyclase (GGDEF)-like protein